MLYWTEVSKCSPVARELADRHYTYRPVKSRKMGREVGPPGQKIVLLATDGKAVWGSHRPAPWSGIKRLDGFEGASCFIYRNEATGIGSAPSSVLIREAVGLTAFHWGVSDFLTYVGVECVEGEIPGYCFLRAGFKRIGYTRSQKIGWLKKLVMPSGKVMDCLLEYLDNRFGKKCRPGY